LFYVFFCEIRYNYRKISHKKQEITIKHGKKQIEGYLLYLSQKDRSKFWQR